MTSKAFGLAQLGNAYSDGALSNRNLIINGAMQVAQRGTSGSTPTTDNYLLDRFALSRFGGYPDNSTQTQESDAPAGHYKSFKMVRNSAHTLTGVNASAFIQRIEGQNMAYLNWGAASAQPVALSFWVKSNKTGNFPLIFADSGNAYDIGKLYTISSADTWEHKTVLIEAPTAGTFDTDNTTGLTIYWGFGAVDASRIAQGTTWGVSNDTGSKAMVTGASTALATDSGATWQITGVQLEAGDTATPFEHRSYGQELALCQRYLPSTFLRTANNPIATVQALSNTVGLAFIPWNVTPRVPPTGISASAASGFYVTNTISNAGFTASALAFEISSNLAGIIRVTHASNAASAGNMVGFNSNTSGATILWTGCEL